MSQGHQYEVLHCNYNGEIRQKIDLVKTLTVGSYPYLYIHKRFSRFCLKMTIYSPVRGQHLAILSQIKFYGVEDLNRWQSNLLALLKAQLKIFFVHMCLSHLGTLSKLRWTQCPLSQLVYNVSQL